MEYPECWFIAYVWNDDNQHVPHNIAMLRSPEEWIAWRIASKKLHEAAHPGEKYPYPMPCVIWARAISYGAYLRLYEIKATIQEYNPDIRELIAKEHCM